MRNEKFDRVAFYLLLGAFFFTPISAYIVIPLLIFSLVFFLLSRKTFSLNFLDKAQFALLGAVILSSIFAVDKIHSFYAGTAFVAYLLAYFLAKGLFNSNRRLESLVKVLGILVLTVSIIGIFQYFTKLG
jgi:heme A synthase